MEVHILNGDALKEKFPKSIGVELIVARECLVDGDVSGNSLTELFNSRQKFLSEAYGLSPEEYQKTIQEFEKILTIKSKTIINLWFEDDLFCQVNFWFCAYLMQNNGNQKEIYLIRPNNDLRYGFGGMTDQALINVYKKRVRIRPAILAALSQLWLCYISRNVEKMLRIAETLVNEFPFIKVAVNAHIERIPTANSPGRPQKTIMDIIEQLGSDSFGPVFQEFSKRESIYGFGDLQVKRLLKELNSPS